MQVKNIITTTLQNLTLGVKKECDTILNAAWIFPNNGSPNETVEIKKDSYWI